MPPFSSRALPDNIPETLSVKLSRRVLKTTLVFYMKKKNTPFMITEAVTQYSLERPQ